MRTHVIARKTHKWLGLFIGLQVVIWSLSGLYMTAVHIDTIHGDPLIRPLPQKAVDPADLADPPKVVAADTPGLDAGAYDAILLAEVDHYFPDPVAWLKSAGAALKPGGRLVISNRIYHKAQTMAAAKKAGLVLVSESSPMPSHFIGVFNAAPGGAK